MVEFETAPSPPSPSLCLALPSHEHIVLVYVANALAGSPEHGWPSGRYHEVNVGLLLTAGRCASRAEAWDGLKGKIHTCGQLTGIHSTYRHPPGGNVLLLLWFPPDSTHTSPQTHLRPFYAVPTRSRRYQSIPTPEIWGRGQ